MESQTFNEFVDKKMREGKKHLGLVKKLFEKQGMACTAHMDEDNPYIYLKNPQQHLSFDGVRIYKLGSVLAYRVQKKEETHPYGKAYLLDLEEMYDDFMQDDLTEQGVAEMIVKTVTDELQKFFNKSAEAETELKNQEFDQTGQGRDSFGKIILRSTGTDYSNMVHSRI